MRCRRAGEQASRRGPRGADEWRRMAANDGCEREGKGQHMQRERGRECESAREKKSVQACLGSLSYACADAGRFAGG